MHKSAQKLIQNLDLKLTQNNRTPFLMLGGLFFIFFIAFTLIVKKQLLHAFDFNMTVRLQDHMPHRFDNFFSFLSVTGRFETSIIILLIVLFLRKKLWGFMTVAFFALAHLIEIFGKNFLYQPGPPHMFLRTTNLSIHFPGLYIDTADTYPSGHSMRVLFLSVVIISVLLKSKKIHTEIKYCLIGFVVIYAIVMLISRVSLGEHWTTDVIGGAFLGLAFGFFSLLFL